MGELGMSFSVRYFFSKQFLGGRFMLWSLFWVNFLGTIYGYYWYWDQLVDTFWEEPLLFVPFVPDSPTASLFFTWFIMYKLVDSYRKTAFMESTLTNGWRGIVEAFAVITSVKYGIWAVSMIGAAAFQGESTVLTDYMLIASHLGMAIEAVLYMSLYRFDYKAVIVVSAWTLLNDYMDYFQGVFPRLPRRLWDDLPAIALFTVTLSIISISIAMIMTAVRRDHRKAKALRR
jgi:uncharacterized membrane protein YpjA